MKSTKGKAIRAVVALFMLSSVFTAPAFGAPKKEFPVENLKECGSRNQIADGKDGRQYKCSISAGGLRWKRTGLKAGAAQGSSGSASAADTAKYANVSGSIAIDGSSTVGPLTGVAAEEFQKVSKTRITVGISGSGGGATRFCNGEIDLANSSTPYNASQRALCEKNGIKFTELRVATDALSVVINPRNNWVKCLTVAQLKRVWEPGSKIQYWSQLDKSFPRLKMPLFGAGTDSGTFEYFTEVINGKPARRSRVDYTPTEDDNVTVNGVKRSRGAMGYYGFSYWRENLDINQALQIDGGKGCTTPSLESVLDGTYTPLARPLFVYANNAKVKANNTIVPFLEFYQSQLDDLSQRAKFLPLTAAQKQKLTADINSLK